MPLVWLLEIKFVPLPTLEYAQSSRPLAGHPKNKSNPLKITLQIMATSLTGGAFGFLRKSIGSITYRTSTSALDGKKRQVASLKPTSVKNPNTVAQIMQRMKMAPAAKFFDALSGILDHSWEGVAYGAKSRLEFMRRAMKNDPAVYVPYGYKSVAPGEYEISAGSLPSLPWRNVISEVPDDPVILLPDFDGVDSMTSEMVNLLENLGIVVGDQITVVGIVETNGVYNVKLGRLIVGVDAAFEMNETLRGVQVLNNGIRVTSNNVAAFAVIVSRGSESSTAKRSNEKMLLLGEYRNLLSLEAMNAAIASYQTKTAYNSLNSDWYLNQGTNQAFNGRIVSGNIAVTPTGGQSTVVVAAIAQQVVNGQIQQKLFTVDGTEEGALIGTDGLPIQVNNVTITYAMVNDTSELAGAVQWSADYLEQAGF